MAGESSAVPGWDTEFLMLILVTLFCPNSAVVLCKGSTASLDYERGGQGIPGHGAASTRFSESRYTHKLVTLKSLRNPPRLCFCPPCLWAPGLNTSRLCPSLQDSLPPPPVLSGPFLGAHCFSAVTLLTLSPQSLLDAFLLVLLLSMTHLLPPTRNSSPSLMAALSALTLGSEMLFFCQGRP